MPVTIKNHGDFSNFDNYIKKSRKTIKVNNKASLIAEDCIRDLKENTPKDTGLTAESWTYEIKNEGKKTSIIFKNTNIQNGINIALLIEFGHATPSGTWVEGREYIDQSIQQRYLTILNKNWKELTKK